MIKNGRVDVDLLNDNMYILKLYENVKTYEYTLEYLMTDPEKHQELIEDVISNVKNIKKLYEYYSNNLLILALVDDTDKKSIVLNSWIDTQINSMFDKLLDDMLDNGLDEGQSEK